MWSHELLNVKECRCVISVALETRLESKQVIIGTPTVESEHMAKMAVVHRDPVEASFLRAKKAPSLEPAPLKAMTEKDFDFINRMDNDVEGRRRTAFMEQLKKDPRFRPEMLEPAKSKFQVQRWLASAIVLRRVRGAHASLSPSLSVMRAVLRRVRGAHASLSPSLSLLCADCHARGWADRQDAQVNKERV